MLGYYTYNKEEVGASAETADVVRHAPCSLDSLLAKLIDVVDPAKSPHEAMTLEESLEDPRKNYAKLYISPNLTLTFGWGDGWIRISPLLAGSQPIVIRCGAKL